MWGFRVAHEREASAKVVTTVLYFLAYAITDGECTVYKVTDGKILFV